MKQIQVDVAVIGAGTAGMSAYRGAKQQAQTVVLIEGGAYGTTCARVGCMPSKLLIAAAEASHAIDQTPLFGIHSGIKHIDGAAVLDRVRRERDRFVGFVLESIDSIPASDRLQGQAKFINDHTLQIGNEIEIQARSIVIATGSTPTILPFFRELGDRVVINDDVFEWKTLPESVVVFGAGVIGLELGQALHRLGVRVRIFGRGGALRPLSDPAVIAYAQKTLGAEFPLDANSEVLSLERIEDRVHVQFKGPNGVIQEESFDYLLAATGRVPNLKNLNLGKTSLSLDSAGVPVFDRHTLQCGSHSIFIAGDANQDRSLLHEAADEGRIAGENAGRFPNVQPGKRRSPLGIVFSDPQIATVGSRFDELSEGEFSIGEVSFENQGRSRVMHQNKGLLHLYGENSSGVFLGAEMIGPRAEHMAHLLAWAHQQKLTIRQMLEMPFYHPVIEEGLRTALRDLNQKI